MTTLSREKGYFFHVDGIELPVDLRNTLIEQSKESHLPRLEDLARPEVALSFNQRDIGEVHETMHNVSTSVANDGIEYTWNGHQPEMNALYDLIHPEARRHLGYIILQNCQPYGFMSPHKDWETYGERRKAVMFLPLTPYNAEDWAPLKFYPAGGGELNVGFSHCYVADTQMVHGYENNEHYRAVAAIAFVCDVETLYTLHEQGKLIA